MTASRWLRQFVTVVFWSAVTAGAVIVTAWACAANYLGCKSALELQGYESQPIATDSLIGPWLGAFFGEATLAQFLSLSLVSIEALSFLLIFHFLFDQWRLFQIRQLQQALGDQQQVRTANALLIQQGIVLAMLTTLAVLIVRWDIDLFRYRSLAGAFGIEDPAIATATVQRWDIELQQNGKLFAWNLIRSGAEGYIAMTAGACLGFEIAKMRLAEHFSVLMQPVDTRLARAFSPHVMAEEFSAADVAEAPTGRTEDHPQTATPVPEELPASVAARMAGGHVIGNTNGHTNGHTNGSAARPLFETPAMPATSGTASTPRPLVSAVAEPALHVVIGDADDHVTMTTALAQPERYHVDIETRMIFSRPYWEALNQTDTPPEPEEAHT